MNIVKLIISVLSGFCVCIPLAIKLYEAVTAAARGRNWNVIVDMVIRYMAEAERLFDTGAKRKEWVMAMVKVGAENVDFDLTAAEVKKVSVMIDELCEMAKTVNANA